MRKGPNARRIPSKTLLCVRQKSLFFASHIICTTRSHFSQSTHTDIRTHALTNRISHLVFLGPASGPSHRPQPQAAPAPHPKTSQSRIPRGPRRRPRPRARCSSGAGTGPGPGAPAGGGGRSRGRRRRGARGRRGSVPAARYAGGAGSDTSARAGLPSPANASRRTRARPTVRQYCPQTHFFLESTWGYSKQNVLRTVKGR